MSTTTDRLTLLQRTKAGQRALLEEMYPDLDFSTVPFREYGRLFTGKRYVPGFVGGWKAYGRSNAEDPAKREILPDYSGNGRDIKLYNFAFSGMSGYGGFNQALLNETVQVSPAIYTLRVSDVFTADGTIEVELTGMKEGAKCIFRNLTLDSTIISTRAAITADGKYTVEVKQDCRLFAYIGEAPSDPAASLADYTIHFLPEYPNGLVSDGVDDYGQCVKGFALPDDYTVVAIRKILNEKGVDSSFAAKSSGAGKGAFLLENGSSDTYCYGQVTSNLGPFPPLFIYQTKTSYCGKTITSGTGTDTGNDILCLFRKRVNQSSDYYKCVFYDLRIYDHSLTAEELEAVKDEMMADYEKATGGGIANVHYVADWDGKGRSNDEDEPMRSTWTDKATGKVIDLNNYAFAGMSGWGGYGTDMSNLVPHDDIAVTEKAVTSLKCTSILQQSNSPIAEWGPNRIASGPTTVRFRVTGVSDNLGIRFESYAVGEGLKTLFTATGDGVYTAEISDPAKYYRWIAVTQGTTVYPVNCDITIEQLLLYPGALVSDGVDDYGMTQEAISEEVGTIICHYKNLRVNPPGTSSGRFSYIYELINSQSDSANDRMYMACTGINSIIMGEGGTYNSNEPLSNHSKIPENYNNKMSLFSRANIVTEIGYAAIYRLILIREQLDDAQVEFLKWKVVKEYRDWCLENGYEYAINQLTA